MRILFAITFLALISRADCTLQLVTNGAIGPGTHDYVQRGVEKAKELNCKSILYLINTPGGSLQSTRLIVETIVNSPMPFLCLIYPSGGHAGSAGAIIMQACHVNGAMEATNIGAATPVTMQGELGEDMRKKMVNDTVSWLDGLAELRGRNKKFTKDIVESAKSVESREAHQLGAIDLLPTGILDFLEKSKGRTVKMTEQKTQSIEVGAVTNFEPDIRFKILDLVTHPQIAYLIFMGSLALLYFEVTHPGMIAPGVFGVMGLVISLISFHMLDVRWGSLALILLGIAFMIAEVFVTSFGALGIGGIISFVAGSLLLFDPSVGSLPLSTVLPSAVGFALALLGIGYLALSAQRTRKKVYSMEGRTAIVTMVDEFGRSGKVEVAGEIWNFESAHGVQVKDKVLVVSVDGLKLNVKKKES